MRAHELLYYMYVTVYTLIGCWDLCTECRYKHINYVLKTFLNILVIKSDAHTKGLRAFYRPNLRNLGEIAEQDF